MPFKDDLSSSDLIDLPAGRKVGIKEARLEEVERIDHKKGAKRVSF